MSDPFAPSDAWTALLRVCVTGPESTGKTTLAREIAAHHGTSWVPEASRVYAERMGAPLVAADVEPIAREHVAMAERAAMDASRLLVLDTDLLSTVIYARHYYGHAPVAVERAAAARRSQLYLLCDVDVPWIPDGIRDRPTDREAMRDLFRAALDEHGLPWIRIHGDWTARRQLAIDAVDALVRRAR